MPPFGLSPSRVASRSKWPRAWHVALRPGALADDTESDAAVLAAERTVSRGVLWRAGLLDVGIGAIATPAGYALGLSLERWLVAKTDGGWDFFMNVEHDGPWLGAGLGGIYLLTGFYRLLGAAFPSLLGGSRLAATARIVLIALLGSAIAVGALLAVQGTAFER